MSKVSRIMLLVGELVEREVIQLAVRLLEDMDTECKRKYIAEMQPEDREFFAQHCSPHHHHHYHHHKKHH